MLRERLPGLVLALACALGLGLAAEAQQASAEPPSGEPVSLRGGLHPMEGNAEVPLEWMPPGSARSPVPSDEIFPPQSLPLRFNHKKHVKELNLTCKVCHAAAYGSDASSDRLLPTPATTCDSCHDVDHADRQNVKAGKETHGQCSFCHLGADAGVGGRVAPVVIPHAQPALPPQEAPRAQHRVRPVPRPGRRARARDARPAPAHGRLLRLPRHERRGPGRGPQSAAQLPPHGARTGRCSRRSRAGELATAALAPQRGPHADWIERHKTVAGDDSAFCGSCHTDVLRRLSRRPVRPRNVHPNDWISMHPQAARQDNPRCTSCHPSRPSAPTATDAWASRGTPGRKPPRRAKLPSAAVGVDHRPRAPMHHAWEAQRNLNACVSCHTERDCTTCHATKGLSGGQGVNPHPIGFVAKCRTALSRNPRPCYVCHQPNDPYLRSCE
jgi:hypothetical protein